MEYLVELFVMFFPRDIKFVDFIRQIHYIDGSPVISKGLRQYANQRKQKIIVKQNLQTFSPRYSEQFFAKLNLTENPVVSLLYNKALAQSHQHNPDSQPDIRVSPTMVKKKSILKPSDSDDCDFSVDGHEEENQLVRSVNRLKISLPSKQLVIGYNSGPYNFEITYGHEKIGDNGEKLHKAMLIRLGLLTVSDAEYFDLKLNGESADAYGFSQLILSYPKKLNFFFDNLVKFQSQHLGEMEEANQGNPAFNHTHRAEMDFESLKVAMADTARKHGGDKPDLGQMILTLPKDPITGMQMFATNEHWQGETWNDKLSENDMGLKMNLKPIPIDEIGPDGENYETWHWEASWEFPIGGPNNKKQLVKAPTPKKKALSFARKLEKMREAERYGK